MVVLCAGCDRPIIDRFLLNVLDRAWHVGCVQCDDCRTCLSERCFSRDGKLYCRQDFFRRFGAKCGGCEQEIGPSELVRRARSRVYHVTCFTCVLCEKELSTGEELYMLDETRFICKDDYLAKFQGTEADDADGGDLDPASLLDVTDDAAFSDKDVTSPSRDGYDDDCDDVIESRGRAMMTSNAGARVAAQPPAGFHIPPPGLTVSYQGGQMKPTGLGGPGSLSPGCSVGLSPVSGAGPCCGAVPPGVKTERLNDDVGSNCSVETSSKDKENNNSSGGPKDSSGTPGMTGVDTNTAAVAGKRRGPRTTIKAKQLETLKAAFAATPKPTRHIREQLAQETGLNMRVIQVWFQNRRSKERRMKQLSALGVRRQFYRNPRRLRALRPGEDLDGADLLGQHGFSYFVDGAEFYAGYPAYADYFASHHHHHHHHPGHPGPQDPGSAMTYLPPTSAQQPALIDHVSGAAMHDGTSYLPSSDMVALRQTASSSPPDSSPMAAMLRDATSGPPGHFQPGGPPPPNAAPGPPVPHGIPGTPTAVHASPFSRYPGLRHGPPISQAGGQPQPNMEVPAEIW